MSCFVSVLNGVVVQKQCDAEAGFIEAPDNVCCGMTYDGVLFSNPTPVVTVQSKCAEIEEYCNAKFAAGLAYNLATFQIDDESQKRINMRASYALASKLDPVASPWGTTYAAGWWDSSNIYHAMTVDEFLAFAKAVSDYSSACAKCCRDHKSAVTPENCATYDFSAGWPA